MRFILITIYGLIGELKGRDSIKTIYIIKYLYENVITYYIIIFVLIVTNLPYPYIIQVFVT